MSFSTSPNDIETVLQCGKKTAQVPLPDGVSDFAVTKQHNA